jgi:curved DNA-binding protein CbpA
MSSDPPELNEDVDLSVEERRYVLDAYAKLSTLSHYALLQVSRDADKKVIKRAYFRLINVIHPDRFFGKKLGSYKAKMEALLSRLSLAYETLAVAATRAEYDREIAETSDESAEKAPVERKVIAQRNAAMEALKQRFLDAKADKKAIAKKHVEAATRARAAGDFAAAAEAYRLALDATPDDATLTAAHDEMKRAVGDRLAESLARQAALEERYGHWAEAAATWRRLTEARPDDVAARERFAKALAMARVARGG